MRARTALLIIGFASAAVFAADRAPNTIVVSPRLVTSGQPSRAFLETLKAQGFQVVVYLAPPSVPDAIADEPKLVAKQGLMYVNVPIEWGAPTAADLDSVSRVLEGMRTARASGRTASRTSRSRY